MKSFSIALSAVVLLTITGLGCASHSHCKQSDACCAAPTNAAVAAPAPAPAAVQPATGLPVAAASGAPVKLKVVKVDSEETAGEDGKGANAVDGDPATLWHTQWQDSAPECPHEITLELEQPATIKGFTYLPRQDDSENGTIKGYEFYVSADGTNFEKVAQGSFENNKDKKIATFAAVKARAVKLKAVSEVNDGAWTSAAEIGVVAAE